MVSIHFNNINKEKNFYINSKEDLSEILDKISDNIEEENKLLFKDNSRKEDLIFMLTLNVARTEFRNKILEYFYGKED